MMLTSDQKLQIVLAAAHTTLDAQGVVDYEDIPLGASLDPTAPRFPQPGSVAFSTNGVTAVDICPAPASGFVRRITNIMLNNTDTGTITPSIQIFGITAAAVLKVIAKFTRATLEQYTYTHASGHQGYSVALVRQ
jgi:hypothetical protein